MIEEALTEIPQGAKLLSDFFPDGKIRVVICQSFTIRGSRFGFLAYTKVNYKRYNKPFVKNSIKVFFTKETLDRDIEFLENYPDPKNRYLRDKKHIAVSRLKDLRSKAFE